MLKALRAHDFHGASALETLGHRSVGHLHGAAQIAGDADGETGERAIERRLLLPEECWKPHTAAPPPVLRLRPFPNPQIGTETGMRPSPLTSIAEHRCASRRRSLARAAPPDARDLPLPSGVVHHRRATAANRNTLGPVAR